LSIENTRSAVRDRRFWRVIAGVARVSFESISKHQPAAKPNHIGRCGPGLRTPRLRAMRSSIRSNSNDSRPVRM